MSYTVKQDLKPTAQWLGYVRFLNQKTEGRRELMERYPRPSAVLEERSDPRLDPWRATILGESVNGAQKVPEQAWFLPLIDSTYPALLAECTDAPSCLFGLGDMDILSAPAIAIVGSRKPSLHGQDIAKRFAFDLARAGFVIVSGLASGIDTSAHRGALAAGGKTIAVMATGIDSVYPHANKDLAHAISESGALVTQFFPQSSPMRHHFPRRNRTISGLSIATVVVEAGVPSGTLITANAAAEQGRDVYALPWSIKHDLGKGCLHLLAEGAMLATSVEDIVRGSGWLRVPHSAAASEIEGRDSGMPTDVPERHSKVLRLIGDGCHSADQLAAICEVDIALMHQWLTAMEIEGFLIRESAGYRKRICS